jgi:hypothetical protein
MAISIPSTFMTPLRFAQQFCANYQPGGSCLGAWIADDGKITSCSPKPKCVLPARCRYFEECVAPNAQRVAGPTSLAMQAAVHSYFSALASNEGFKSGPDGKRPEVQRTCACGAPITARRRFCELCRALKRREANREAQRAHRMSAVNGKTRVEQQGVTGAVFGDEYDHSGHPQNPGLTADRTPTGARQQ